MDLLVCIEELEKTVAEQAKIIAAQAKILKAKDDTIAGLTKKIVEIEAKLAKYENPHTPSSARRFKKKPKDQTPKRRGAPKGHRGGNPANTGAG